MRSLRTIITVLGVAASFVFFAPAISVAAAHSHHTWYVSASAPTGGNGSRHAPFSSLAAVQAASRSGDTIVVEPSPLYVPPLNGGITLKPGQRLIGGGAPVVHLGQPLVTGGPPLVRSSNRSWQPRIANTTGATNSGDAVELADGASVKNIVITSAYRGAIYGKDVVGVTVQGNDLSDFNTSGTTGFVVQPFYLESYTAGQAIHVANGIPAGWAGILIDTSSVTTDVSIGENYLHDGACGDGIDLRAMGTGNVTAHVSRNFLTRLTQCSAIRTLEGIGTQVTGTSRLHVALDGNTEAEVGSPGANADSLFVNPAEAGRLIETINRNLFTSGVGGPSTNGMEFILSNGSAYSRVAVSHSVFLNNPGDTLEEFNRGESGSTAVLVLDHVTVDKTTITGGIPPYAIPPGTATVPDNTGECLGIGSVGSNDTTVLHMVDSQFLGCDNNGIEVTNNHAIGDGVGDPHTVVLDIDRSRISGSRYYNLWFNNVTPLANLHVRVQDTDLSKSLSGVAVGFDQQPTASTGSYAIDLGGGALGSKGRNCIYGSAIYDLESKGYDVSAEHNWWGSASGAQPGKVVASAGASIDDTSPLREPAAACTRRW